MGAESKIRVTPPAPIRFDLEKLQWPVSWTLDCPGHHLLSVRHLGPLTHFICDSVSAPSASALDRHGLSNANLIPSDRRDPADATHQIQTHFLIEKGS